MKQWSLSLFSLILVSSPQLCLAAACCGGGFAAPSIITSDDRAQLTTSYSFTEVTVDNVDSRGIWRTWDEHQRVQAFRIEGAHLISDLWQAGFTLPVLQRSRLGETHAGLGDISASLGYEYLPDWDYNPFRPKGVGFLQLTLPTGLARAESELGGMDSRGNGFLAIGAGTLLTKAVGKYDVFTSLEVHRSFSKEFSNSQMSGTLKPGFGGSFEIGGGYNWTSLRLGTAVIWTYEDPIEVESQSGSVGSLERFATAAFSMSYLVNDEWAGTLSYADQTLFGSPINTSLGKTIALVLQRRWAR